VERGRILIRAKRGLLIDKIELGNICGYLLTYPWLGKNPKYFSKR